MSYYKLSTGEYYIGSQPSGTPGIDFVEVTVEEMRDAYASVSRKSSYQMYAPFGHGADACNCQEDFLKRLEQWLKSIRDQYPKHEEAWHCLDSMLNDVRMAYATGELPWEKDE